LDRSKGGRSLHERGTDITHETVRFWWSRFGTIFAAEIWRSRVEAMRSFRHRRGHLDEMFVKIKGVKWPEPVNFSR
jgi:putative transposase